MYRASYLSVHDAALLEGVEEVLEELVFGLLAANVLRMVQVVVDAVQILHSDDAGAVAVELREDLLDESHSVVAHWRLNRGNYDRATESPCRVLSRTTGFS